jgi:nitric oxide reductase NorD protein
MNPVIPHALEPLSRADPELATRVAERLARTPWRADPELLERLASETIWALGVEISFGQAVAGGLADLIGAAAPERLDVFCRHVRDAAHAGPTQGRIMAERLPAVLQCGAANVLDGFLKAWRAMAQKGSHTLGEPLQALDRLLAAGDRPGAAVYLGLLHDTFARDLTYEEGRYLSRALPRTALGLTLERRAWQLAELCRVIRTHHRLTEPFLTGLGKGLALLSENALKDFVSDALARYRRNPGLGTRHLALESRAAQEHCASLQVNVGFAQVRDRLQRYLQARTGLALVLRPLSEIAAAPGRAPGALVCSDGHAIYLPVEIGRFVRRQDNLALYTLLVRLEACFHEFGTVDFDLEKALERCRPYLGGAAPPDGGAGDLGCFLGMFPDPMLAADLFTVFELGRIRQRLLKYYPGLVRHHYPLLRREALADSGPASGFLACLFLRLALGLPEQDCPGAGGVATAALATITGASEAALAAGSPVEASAELTARFFDTARLSCRMGGVHLELTAGSYWPTPFGWRPWPNPATSGRLPFGPLAHTIRAALAQKGLKAYAADIRRRLAANAGGLSAQDVRELCGAVDLSGVGVDELLGPAGRSSPASPDESPENDPVFWYPEWDAALGDYLPQHVCMRERTVAADGAGFYADVLRRHHALVVQTRRAFERLRPESLRRLGQWVDGDEFDTRKLIDLAVDRRTGEVPSERIYAKRVKDRREVAALLLVDISRSTANSVPGSGAAVLDVEKEAIVILCEALRALGDGFAVAGFSGSGRLGVDYFRIKGFEEPLSDEVKGRIGAVQPQHNTRMGAAIRHAGRELEETPGRVRLLMVLSDGFPNDAGYRHQYAVADTRKAVSELSARHIRFHALTVNLPADPRLDELYGKARHHVISEVAELPGRLLRVYSALTR